jgi:hypothetical protein
VLSQTSGDLSGIEQTSEAVAVKRWTIQSHYSKVTRAAPSYYASNLVWSPEGAALAAASPATQKPPASG